MAAEKAIIDKYGISWISYTPTGGWTVYYAYEQGKTLATTDIYGNTVRTDEQFYHNLPAISLSPELILEKNILFINYI